MRAGNERICREMVFRFSLVAKLIPLCHGTRSGADGYRERERDSTANAHGREEAEKGLIGYPTHSRALNDVGVSLRTK